jgi:cation:H+ antiporter
MLVDTILAVVAIILLYVGAEMMVHFSSSFAKNMGMSPFLIGVTIIAFTTSAPEAITSIVAQCQQGNDSVTMGNIIGSNIANIGLVVGLMLVISPLKNDVSLRKWQIPSFFVSTLIFAAMFFHHHIGYGKAVILLGVFCVFLVVQILVSKNKNEKYEEKPTIIKSAMVWEIVWMIIGLAGVLVGAYLLVEAGVSIADSLGVSKRVIGLTLVALGTSLPELAISLVSIFRKKITLAVGNILGSNIFNSLFIVGVASLVKPINIDARFCYIDMPVMVFMTALLTVMFLFFKKINRFVGVILLMLYSAYMLFFVV